MKKWLLALALVAACKKEDAAKQQPVIVVTRNEITYKGQLIEPCALLADKAKRDWVGAANEMAKLGSPCSAHVEPVIAAMVVAMEAKTYGDAEHGATKALLDAVPLSAEQNDRVMAAAAKLEVAATAKEVEQVREVRSKCIHNRERKPPALPK